MIIAQYLTQSGQDGLTVTRHEIGGRVSYSYTGKWGAGSGNDFADIQKRVAQIIANRRGIQVVKELKGNPIMATKKPTPAQVAARKTFADMARAGAFKKAKRKPAAKKRAANPAKKSAPVGSQRIGSQIAKLVQAGLSLKDATAFVVNNESIKPRAEKLSNAVKYARQLLNYPDPLRVTKRGVVRRNPVARNSQSIPASEQWALRGAPKRNPAPHTRIAPPSAYAVHRALKSGEPGALIGKFPSLALAKEYASAYATAHKCAVGIVGKK